VDADQGELLLAVEGIPCGVLLNLCEMVLKEGALKEGIWERDRSGFCGGLGFRRLARRYYFERSTAAEIWLRSGFELNVPYIFDNFQEDMKGVSGVLLRTFDELRLRRWNARAADSGR
jgi:hypothetical protein